MKSVLKIKQFVLVVVILVLDLVTGGRIIEHQFLLNVLIQMLVKESLHLTLTLKEIVLNFIQGFCVQIVLKVFQGIQIINAINVQVIGKIL